MDFDSDIRPSQIVNAQDHSEWDYRWGPTLGATLGAFAAAAFIGWAIGMILERLS